jgi:uncharacterized protein (DUF427 family)
MSARVLDTLLPRLRHEPMRKRLRATLAGAVVVDSTEAVLVWEPHRVIPAYAVPRDDLRGELLPAPPAAAPAHPLGFRLPGGQTVLDPSVPFAVHSTDGEPLSLSAAGETRDSVAFQPADPDLGGHVVLDFDGFDAWYEEDEPVMAHARDPFHSMDILASSRRVRVELDGELLAETSRSRLLFEGTLLPPRAYIPREDVRVPLHPSAKRTRCAYKGEASYWSAELPGGTLADVAWTYEAPTRAAGEVTGLVAFFNERVDLSLDGKALPRPVTPWS